MPLIPCIYKCKPTDLVYDPKTQINTLKKPSLQINIFKLHTPIMSPAYQTDNTTTEKDALVNEPSSTGTTMLKKVSVAALVGAAFVVGNSRGSSMNTPKTEIEAFLSSVKPYVKPYDGITSCSGRWFSTAPLVSENILPGETICGQVCLTRVQEVGLGFAPPPTPVMGDCPSRGYTIDSGESFNAIPFPGFPSARVFTKP